MRAKVRELSQHGVLADISPFNLPPNAASMAVNLRFADEGIQRAPVYKRVPVTLAEADPRFLTSNVPTTGFDTLIIGYLNGKVSSYNGTESDVSVFGYSTNESDTPYTSCRNADVLYINREDRVPWALRTSDSIFQKLDSTSLYTSGNDEWDTNWRCKILRSCAGALCAFGISKSGTLYPTMVKTSEFAEVNTVPQDWDETDPTNNATENILSEMEGGITDAQALGNVMYVYGLNETWQMTPDGSSDVWVYERVFSDAGALNTNCAVEVDKQHFVFGLNDIWRHDGTQKASIIDGRNRRFVFNSIDLSKSNRCFVQYDRLRKEVRFYYVSGDAYVAFSGAEGCNRVAIFNLVRNTWTFDDTPFAYGASTSNFNTAETYATTSAVYSTTTATYLDQEDSKKKTLVVACGPNATYGLTTDSMYAVDDVGMGAFVPYDVTAGANARARLIHDGIDLDEITEDLTGYKLISSIFPQARFESGSEPLYFKFAAANQYNDELEWSDPQSYDGSTYYQCDFASSGRYLAMEMYYDDTLWFELSGFDVDMDVTGEA